MSERPQAPHLTPAGRARIFDQLVTGNATLQAIADEIGRSIGVVSRAFGRELQERRRLLASRFPDRVGALGHPASARSLADVRTAYPTLQPQERALLDARSQQ